MVRFFNRAIPFTRLFFIGSTTRQAHVGSHLPMEAERLLVSPSHFVDDLAALAEPKTFMAVIAFLAKARHDGDFLINAPAFEIGNIELFYFGAVTHTDAAQVAIRGFRTET